MIGWRNSITNIKMKSGKPCRPLCYGKCGNCFFHYINNCAAICGDDFYIEIKQRQAELILKNSSRFSISQEHVKELSYRFFLNRSIN